MRHNVLGRILPLVGLTGIISVFFWKLFFHGLLPIPLDTIVGLYHPWRDLIWNGYTTGVPYKNFLITDPVRQQYPWRELSISLMKKGILPLWNPYSFSGTPLLANQQSAPFYPLNIIYWFLPFPLAWSILVLFQPLLAAWFTYLYLKNLRLNTFSSFFGGIVFAFSGFFTAWLTWNTIGHTLFWLPLILLAIDKIIAVGKLSRSSKLKLKKQLIWTTILIFSLSSSLLAGHLQIYFYVLVFTLIYSVYRIFALREKKKSVSLFLTSCFLIHFTVTSFQWIPTLRFITLSARNINRPLWQKPDWFFPWKHLIQFVVPDFFGNPATLNYWGIWNYGEFIGYIGILPLFLVLYVLMFKKDRNVRFYLFALAVILIFILPTPIGKIPFVLKIPFLWTSQPSRLLSLIDFILAVLSAIGINRLMSNHSFLTRKRALFPPLVFLVFLIGLWTILVYTHWQNVGNSDHWSIAQRNSILPTVLIFITFLLYGLIYFNIMKRRRYMMNLIMTIVMLFTIFDLFRFSWKFTPFSDPNWVFPKTGITTFLQQKQGPFRIMSMDSRIFPPNFSIPYRLQTVEGYNPLYLKRYSEYISMWIRGEPDISQSNFNRIITPQNFESRLANLSNVKYILSFNDENSPKLRKVFHEGKTNIYENLRVLPRAFLTEGVKVARSKAQVARLLFESQIDLGKTAIVEKQLPSIIRYPLEDTESIDILSYKENEIIIHTKVKYKRVLILTDTYYPAWKAFVDDKETIVYQVDYVFRGIIVSPGKHKIRFAISLW